MIERKAEIIYSRYDQLFRNIENISDYKYSTEIMINLFRSPYQTEMINRMRVTENGFY